MFLKSHNTGKTKINPQITHQKQTTVKYVATVENVAMDVEHQGVSDSRNAKLTILNVTNAAD